LIDFVLICGVIKGYLSSQCLIFATQLLPSTRSASFLALFVLHLLEFARRKVVRSAHAIAQFVFRQLAWKQVGLGDWAWLSKNGSEFDLNASFKQFWYCARSKKSSVKS
jgi:hypothetical protein